IGVAVNAHETVTFFRRKIGHALLPGRLHCGNVRVADIGIPAGVLDHIAPRTWINAPDLWRKAFPLPRVDGHKYARGHAVVVSGGLASTGAARLGARGAVRAGAGVVTLAPPPPPLAGDGAARPSGVVAAVGGARVGGAEGLPEFLRPRRRNTVVLGPGGGVGHPMRELVLAALTGERAVVLDADALTSFANERQTLVAATKARSKATLMTPHEGEFSRLFKMLEAEAPSKLEKARKAAQETGAVILLKVPDTVVAA